MVSEILRGILVSERHRPPRAVGLCAGCQVRHGHPHVPLVMAGEEWPGLGIYLLVSEPKENKCVLLFLEGCTEKDYSCTLLQDQYNTTVF